MSSRFFLGAEVASNNTGEITAIAEALLWLGSLRRLAPKPRIRICYDSTEAVNIVAGAFRAGENVALADWAKAICAEAGRAWGISFQHVKGHSGG
eukprot:7133769-Alexandrium_andersonii.AAC.1